MTNNRKLIPLNIQKFSDEIEVGKTIQINGSATLTDVDTSKESRVLRLLGQTSQNGTPTPSSPIPVNVVSGDNTIDICGKNLFDKTSQITSNKTYTSAGGTITLDGAFIQEKYIRVNSSTSYTLSTTNDYTETTDFRLIICEYDENKNFIKRGIGTKSTISNNEYSITTTSTTKYVRLGGNSVFLDELQFEKGTKTTYTPYTGNSYPIYLGVENLYDGVFRQGTHVNTSTANCLCSDNEMKSVSGKQYTFYTNLPSTFKYKIMNCTSSGTSTTVINDTSYSTSGSVSVNCTADGYLKILVKNNDDSNLTPSTIAGYTFQVGIGTNHVSSTPIELCKIGTYQDYIYKDNGSWYLHKEIGKVVLDGSENWTRDYGNNLFDLQDYLSSRPFVTGFGISNYYKYNSAQSGINANTSNGEFALQKSYYEGEYKYNIFIKNTDFSNADDFKTWLSTHNTTVYYPLATPTNTEITDTTLIEQLEALQST